MIILNVNGNNSDPYLTIMVEIKKDGFLFKQDNNYNFSRIDDNDLFRFGSIIFDPRINMFIGTSYQLLLNNEQQLIHDYFQQKIDAIERKYLKSVHSQHSKNECLDEIVLLIVQQRFYFHVRHFQIYEMETDEYFEDRLFRSLEIADSCLHENDTIKIGSKEKKFEYFISSSERSFVSVVYYFFHIRYYFFNEHKQINILDRRKDLRKKVQDLSSKLYAIIFDLEFYRFNFSMQKQRNRKNSENDIIIKKFFIMFDILIQMREFYYQNLVD
ncbi:hypothetical protein BLA29_004430 [Euroglyphus maynei]|uniref:Uncharacterized protein n=1 Tax=Euroglyphus maynei TaxID=6958 RepID=A0A1Y3B8X9_EURMA|nr:hypothetical protein BLA29_004430 [Euroglyphus maynei]